MHGKTAMERQERDKKIKYLLLTGLCTLIYFVWFFLLERNVTTNYHLIHVGLDDYIPYCEYFIIPYVSWFFYVIVIWAWAFFNEEQSFVKMSRFLFGGMFISLFICTIYPNGIDLRPAESGDGGLCSKLVELLWKIDTPTNVLPSIHVYNSIGINIAIWKSERFGNDRKVKLISLIWCIAICLSTVFLKQHSCADVLVAGLLAYTMYEVVYEPLGTDELAGGSLRRRLAKRKT